MCLYRQHLGVYLFFFSFFFCGVQVSGFGWYEGMVDRRRWDKYT
jgi:hypothetical protein